MVQTAVPIATLENTGSHWGVTGAASAHEALADASDASYVMSAGHASAVLRLSMGALLRPHVRATAFAFTVRWALTAGAFATPPVVRLLDDATEEWVRVYATASLTAPAVGSPADATYTIPSNLIRGHRSDGGVYDFGDTGVEIQAPNGASGGAELRVYRAFEELEDVYPFSTQTTDIRVQRTGSVWEIVDVAGAIPGGSGTWTTAPQLGEVLDSANVGATAVYLAGFLPSSGTLPKVIGIKSGTPQIGGFTLNGNNFTSKPSAFWKSGTVSSPGAIKMIDKLLIRSEATGSSVRAEITTPFIQPLGPSGNHTIDLGWISFESVRFYRSSGSNYAIQVPDEARSEETLLGCYDCHFTGPGNFGGTFEMKTAYRGGYIGIDFIDCQQGSTEEHNFYHSGPTQDSQILRCKNEVSTVFYPAHPLPDTVNGGKRIGRTGNQVVGRTNKCAGGGQGPPAHETLLVEDCTFDWANFTEDSSALTYDKTLGDIIVRRVDLPNCGGGFFLAWCPATPSQQGVVHGMHLEAKTGALGQFTSMPWTGSCSGAGQWGGPQTPQSIPQSGFVSGIGDVVIEDLSGVSTSGSPPIRTGGCKSVLVVRGDLSNTTKVPKIHAYPWGEVSNVWKWSASGAGPFEDLDFRFEVPASAASITAYYNAGTSGGLSNLMGFGAADNSANNTGGAGNTVLDARLTATQINGLTVGGSQAWPPWSQRMDWPGMSSNIPGIRFGGLFPNMSPPTDYGIWKNAIYDPGKNTFTPQTLEHVAGDGAWANGVASEVLMLGDSFTVTDVPGLGIVLHAPEMTGDPFVVEMVARRGHIELEGATAGGTMDPFTVKSAPQGLVSGPVMFPFTIAARPAVGYLFLPRTLDRFDVEIVTKRGHITFPGTVGGTMDPFVVEAAPGPLTIGPMMTGETFSVLDEFLDGSLAAVTPLTSSGWAGASSKVRRALGDLIGRPFDLGIQYDNDGANRFNTGLWCRLSVQHRATRRSTATGLSAGGVATGVIHRTGDMIAQLFAPIVEGDGGLLAIADVIEKNLRSVTIEGVTYHVPSTERVGRTSDNRWWQVNTTVPFSFVQEI